MAKWSGKSRGTLLGYKIFVFSIKNFGVRFAYSVLYFVAAYYFLFLKKSNQHIFTYFRRRLRWSNFKSKKSVFWSYFTFGQTLIDKTAISAGLRNQFTYEFDGIENLKKMMQDKKGGVLISAHIGNFEIAERFFAEIDFDYQINLVTTDQEHNVIKEYLESVSEKRSSIKFIFINDDMSHIFAISEALSKNEIICFTGDRYFEGSKFLEAELLGKPAKFPAGPFSIASRLKVPVAFVYVMKEPNLHYHLYARIAEVKHRDANGLLNSFVRSLESMLEKYPLQWFNYYDFWDDFN
ncbi:lipid A biosynthesis acyltransferase [Chryseobacterium suipulveris]|uniref:Lipid A biosynthesis acyltransferase n=1 Tax=Chryseobacterium suipulveris TaxID=2929800 RepID=A0ABY4BT31_9FLAO|nr:lipid A biosynthesis acyltransferase [Chryseobacterium suipulveris]UOE40843.1 lipid A biosynthesis acyltransferase [Chryseobacterium suipulveris]